MNWKLEQANETGMTVTGPRGRVEIFWEQKPVLVEAGILAVWVEDGNLTDFVLPVAAGEVAGVDHDTTITGAVRDADLMKLFLAERAKLDDAKGPTVDHSGKE